MIDHASRLDSVEQPMPECWRIVGVSGDRSCPELARFIHCRNCPVLAEAARQFFDRPAPPGYLEAWQTVLEAPDERPDADATSLLVFRLDTEWLALPTAALVEVTPVRRIHAVPHRSGTPLAGIVNIRGRLELCMSLHALLGVPGGPRPPVTDDPPATDDNGLPRMLVVERHEGKATQRWVLGVDDVAGVQRVPASALRKIPATVGQAPSRCSSALFHDSERSVAVLDRDRLFDALERAVVA
jgi:chemotaxis signal transduction protein